MYSHATVIGTKTVISAQPLDNEESDPIQSAVLCVTKSSKKLFGLSNTSTITDIKKLPFTRLAKLDGPSAPGTGNNSFNNRNVGASMVIKHSPKKFNNMQSLRDNEQMSFGCALASAPDGTLPEERDYLTISVVPSMTNYHGSTGLEQRKATNFKLSIRHEATVLFREPLANLSEGTGNYSYPRPDRDWETSRENTQSSHEHI